MSFTVILWPHFVVHNNLDSGLWSCIGVDYEEGPYHVNISRGDTKSTLCINITDNSYLAEQGDKAFSISINNQSGLHPDVIPMDPSEATVTIIDDECKHLDCEG